MKLKKTLALQKMSFLPSLILIIMLISPASAVRSGTVLQIDRPYVILDPGHGGTDRGSPNLQLANYCGVPAGGDELMEADITLEISKLVRKKLIARGVRVDMTRTEDVAVELGARYIYINDRQPDLAVSIHTNSGNLEGLACGDGIEAWYSSRTYNIGSNPYLNASRKLAQALAVKINEQFGLRLRRNNGIEDAVNHHLGCLDLVCGPTVPSALIELAHISNITERELLVEQQEGFAQAVYEAIIEQLDLPPLTGNVDVALIIDSSGSMTSNDPYNKRLDAAKAYLTASSSGDYVGVIDFDSVARIASPLLRLPENKGVLINAINTINSSGSTNIGLGVQTGCNVLLASPSINIRRGAILLTDGVGSFSGQDACFVNNGWPIYAFGFGGADDNLLTQIATNTGGEYKRLPTSDLVCEFQRVKAKIAGVEPGPCTAHRINPLEVIQFIIRVIIRQAQVTFSNSWEGSDVEMSLISPSGRVIDRNTIAPDVIHDLGATYEVYTILNPEPGDWQVVMYGADIPEGGEDTVFGFSSIPMASWPYVMWFPLTSPNTPE